jgi:hypothetical protein
MSYLVSLEPRSDKKNEETVCAYPLFSAFYYHIINIWKTITLEDTLALWHNAETFWKQNQKKKMNRNISSIENFGPKYQLSDSGWHDFLVITE